MPVKYKCSIFIRNVTLRSHSMLVWLANYFFLGKPLQTQITNLQKLGLNEKATTKNNIKTVFFKMCAPRTLAQNK